jgi:predicted nucleotidyltransferase
MDTEKIRKLTPYQDINSLLADWTEEAKNILGEKVVGLYLSGSLSYGDFVPERSDIDLQAVVRRPLNETGPRQKKLRPSGRKQHIRSGRI